MKLDIKYDEFSDKSHSALKLLKCMCKILPSRRTILIVGYNLGNANSTRLRNFWVMFLEPLFISLHRLYFDMVLLGRVT